MMLFFFCRILKASSKPLHVLSAASTSDLRAGTSPHPWHCLDSKLESVG